ncbi:hypothetical protein OHB13_38125 (plasmid) [Streptomyces sp. NBC_00440]|uniref:hypothetical protein n=1 Tax=unclassified Streptomyces TaxID=2593676 RepID=UPI002E1EB428|nr:hypothetical protein OG217_37350 [Streptomyces sp. NBC_01023]
MADADAQKRHIHYPPVPNGIDYLRDVIDRLARESGEPSERDLKYAVLHLQAAAEVLLKARLREEHWSLVISKAEKTNRKKFEKGEFESATNNETVRRLVEAVGLDISADDKKTLLDLATTRNQLQHWGITEEANAVLTRAADVLDFLIRFLDQHLLPDLDADDEAAIADDLEEIRTGLTRIASYVTSRMERLKENDLKGHEDRTVSCPDCQQLALIVDGDTNSCLFCPRDWTDPLELASTYDNAFGYSPAPGDPYEDTLVDCPDCDTPTLVLEAETVTSGGSVPLCFNCAEVQDDLQDCMQCGRLYRPTDEESICSECFAGLAE